MVGGVITNGDERMGRNFPEFSRVEGTIGITAPGEQVASEFRANAFQGNFYETVIRAIAQML